jgi:hypothetical protein
MSNALVSSFILCLYRVCEGGTGDRTGVKGTVTTTMYITKECIFWYTELHVPVPEGLMTVRMAELVLFERQLQYERKE